MIKANELRLGNYLLEGIDILTVGNICAKGFDFIYKGGNRFVEYADVEPIPLTPEILEKCGFRAFKVDRESMFCKDNVVGKHRFFITHKEFFTYENVQWRVKIVSLHQLQNLFYALVGEELNITL